jgi:hypothetical protein
LLTYPRGLGILLICYTVTYGLFLWLTNFFPYVMDNNESFSSLLHAKNLIDFGFAKSFGLADESLNTIAAAHPYVHTHQGNFPRVFATLIYLLGARSIESQITITVFTVGIASVVFAYRFFSRLINPLFALITCLLLITDYMLFMQWQVVTYRVWHGFFVFSTLLCMEGIGATKKWPWVLTTVLNFACLFYWEFIFVAFVTLSAGLYALYLYWGKWKTLFFTLVCSGVGAIIGMSILICQLVLYMGWDGFLHDIYLTYFARNEFNDVKQLLPQMQQFFDSHRIIFWHNLQDGSIYRDPKHFIDSMMYDIELHSPILFWLASALITAYLLSSQNTSCEMLNTAPRKAPSQPIIISRSTSLALISVLLLLLVSLIHRWITDNFGFYEKLGVFISVMIFFFYLAIERVQNKTKNITYILNTPFSKKFWVMVLISVAIPTITKYFSYQPIAFNQYSVYLFVIFLLYLTIATHDLLNKSNLSTDSKKTSSAIFLFIALITVLFEYLTKRPYLLGLHADYREWTSKGAYYLFIFLGLGYLSLIKFAGFDQTNDVWLSRRIRMSAVFVICTGLFLIVIPLLFDASYGELWHSVWHSVVRRTDSLLMMLTIVSGVLMIAIGPQKLIGNDNRAEFRRLIIFLAIGFLAYFIVYVLSPGYIFYGYRLRFVPFTLYFTIILLSFPIYLLIASALHSYRSQNLGSDSIEADSTPVRFASGAAKFAVPAVFALTASLTIYYWVAMQAEYIRLFPLNHMAYLKRLTLPPYKGASFAVNTYTAPVAEFTGKWAYFDSVLQYANLIKVDGKTRLETNYDYLWFADRDTNPDYRRPQYYLCTTPESIDPVIATLKWKLGLGDLPYSAGCDQKGLVKLAQEKNPRKLSPRPTLLEIDNDGLQKLGYAQWAIVKLDWN